jgi:hypothetical protein
MTSSDSVTSRSSPTCWKTRVVRTPSYWGISTALAPMYEAVGQWTASWFGPEEVSFGRWQINASVAYKPEFLNAPAAAAARP